MKLLTVVPFAIMLVNRHCEPSDVMAQRQAVVNLCEARGGIPIINDDGDNITNCVLPMPGAPLNVEKVKP